MFYVLEDKKKISIFINLLKSTQCNQSNNQSSLSILWSQKNGWLIMQNAESLNMLDNKQLVIISHFKSNFFTSCQVDRTTEVSFDMSINNLLKVLKGVQKSVKKLTFQIDTDSQQQRGQFGAGIMANNLSMLTIYIHLDDGQLMIQRQIYQNDSIDQQHFFSEMQEMTQDKPKIIEISQEYFKIIKELKSEYIDLLFYKNHIMIKSSSGEGPVIQINGQCLNMYDIDNLVEQDKNKLSVPPNYLIPQTHMAQKLGRQIEMSFQIGGGGGIGVYCRTQSDFMDVISFFPSQMGYEGEIQQNPFSVNLGVNQTEFNQNVNGDINQTMPNLNNNNNQNNNQRNINEQMLSTSINNTESEYEIPQNKFQAPQSRQQQQNLRQNNQQQLQSEDEMIQNQFKNNIRLNNNNKNNQQQYSSTSQNTDFENQNNQNHPVTNSNRIIDINESHNYVSKKSVQKDNLLMNLNNQQQQLNLAGNKRTHPDINNQYQNGNKKQQLNLFQQNQQQQQQQQQQVDRQSGQSNRNQNNSTLNLTTSHLQQQGGYQQKKSGSSTNNNYSNIINANISSINQVDQSNMNASIFNNNNHHIQQNSHNIHQHQQDNVSQQNMLNNSHIQMREGRKPTQLQQQNNRNTTSNNLITFMNQNRQSAINKNDQSVFINKNKGIQIATQNSNVSGNSSSTKGGHALFKFGKNNNK